MTLKMDCDAELEPKPVGLKHTKIGHVDRINLSARIAMTSITKCQLADSLMKHLVVITTKVYKSQNL